MSEEMNLYKRCKNIFKFHGVDMGGGGESAPEVENAIETHGLGWTGTEEKAGFDIQWDGNTEGLESLNGMFFKITNNLYGIESANDLIGGSMTLTQIDAGGSESETFTIDSTYFMPEMYGAIRVIVPSLELPIPFLIIVPEDVTIEGAVMSKGIWGMPYEDGTLYTSRLYKEATTEEVVHQIDQKYIPGGSGGGLVVNLTAADEETWDSDKTFPEIKQALENGQFVVAKFSIEGKNYIVSGGTLMPGETEDYETIQFMFGASGGAMNCTGNADECTWYTG